MTIASFGPALRPKVATSSPQPRFRLISPLPPITAPSRCHRRIPPTIHPMSSGSWGWGWVVYHVSVVPLHPSSPYWQPHIPFEQGGGYFNGRGCALCVLRHSRSSPVEYNLKINRIQLVNRSKQNKYKKTYLWPKRQLPSFGPVFCPVGLFEGGGDGGEGMGTVVVGVHTVVVVVRWMGEGGRRPSSKGVPVRDVMLMFNIHHVMCWGWAAIT